MSKILVDIKNFLLGEKSIAIQAPVFILMGLSVAAIQFAAFAAVLFLSGNRYFISSAVAFGVAVLSSFMLQRHITFSKQTPRNIDKKHSFSLFLAYSFVNLSVNQAIMYTGVDILQMNAFYTQLVSMSFLATTNFIVYRFIFS